VRYRDKRARLRKLRSGGVSAILQEIDDAQAEREALDPLVQRPLFVRTSDERLAGWDRERIVEALVRETRMPEDEARRVAIDVERQVARAELTTLTAPLVRELVDAKLVELGLERYRARHMRLGVPLYDAEQIVCSPNQGDIEGQQDPAATDIALARRVKREFALSTVHSAEVTEAHLRGDIHLHGLSQIDRLQSASHSLDYVRQFGLVAFGGNRYAPPPESADALIAQASRFAVAMQRHFVEGVRWRAFNDSLSPLLHSGADMDRIARLALFGLTTRSGAPPTTVELRWRQSNVASCMFAMQFADPWGAAADEGGAFGVPRIEVAVDAEALRHADFRAWLGPLLETPVRQAGVTIVFDRGGVTPPGRDWPARDVVGGTVTLNLPRAAYEAKDETALCAALTARARVACDALTEKRNFLERLFAFGSVGPMAALAFRYDGVAYADPRRARYVLGVTGLHECVEHFTGHAPDRAPEALACADRVVLALRKAAAGYSAAGDIDIVLGAYESEGPARRFGRLDLQLHAECARAMVKRDAITRDVTYTPGFGPAGPNLRAGAGDLPPARIESYGMSPAEMLCAIEDALTNTRCGVLQFVCERGQMDLGIG